MKKPKFKIIPAKKTIGECMDAKLIAKEAFDNVEVSKHSMAYYVVYTGLKSTFGDHGVIVFSGTEGDCKEFIK